MFKHLLLFVLTLATLGVNLYGNTENVDIDPDGTEIPHEVLEAEADIAAAEGC
jgi:hypothetical protein